MKVLRVGYCCCMGCCPITSRAPAAAWAAASASCLVLPRLTSEWCPGVPPAWCVFGLWWALIHPLLCCSTHSIVSGQSRNRVISVLRMMICNRLVILVRGCSSFVDECWSELIWRLETSFLVLWFWHCDGWMFCATCAYLTEASDKCNKHKQCVRNGAHWQDMAATELHDFVGPLHPTHCHLLVLALQYPMTC